MFCNYDQRITTKIKYPKPIPATNDTIIAAKNILYNLEIIPVVSNDQKGDLKEAYTGHGKIINSEFLTI